jgi:hypothetical protein
MKMIRPEKLSDDEYVARLRQNDRNIRRARWIYPVCLVVNVGVVYVVATNFRFLLDLSKETRIAFLAFAGGTVYAGALLFFLFATIDSIIGWLKVENGYRTERLLLKYYDESQKMKASNHTPEPIGANRASGSA